MNLLTEKTISFFIDNFPSWNAITLGGPLGLLWAYLCLHLAGSLKRKGWKTGYTRKTFHFLIFGNDESDTEFHFILLSPVTGAEQYAED